MKSFASAQDHVRACQHAVAHFTRINRIVRDVRQQSGVEAAAHDQIAAMVALSEVALDIVCQRLEAARNELTLIEQEQIASAALSDSSTRDYAL